MASRKRKKNKGKSLFIFASYLMVLGLFSCRNDVEDKSDQMNKNVINVDTLTITSKQNIGANTSKNAVIAKKYYTLRACLSENALGQRLERRKIEVEGFPPTENYTDASGCLYWEHTFTFDHTGVDSCKVLKQTITLPQSSLKKTLRYSLDTLNDEVADLDKGQGCTIQEKEHSTKGMKEAGGALVLEKISLSWVGEEEEKRSDVKFLTYRTKIESCLKSRLSHASLSNTPIELKITDHSGVHDPLTIDNIMTDESGCFSKQFTSPYEQFAYSHWLEKDILINIKSGPLKNHHIKSPIYLNPYETNRAFFGIDGRWDRPLENPIKRNNRIHVDGVMYIQIGNDIENFKVNDYLNLTVSKSYQVVLNPRIDRGHRFSKNSDRYIKMHDGRFRLKFMILAPNKANIEINENNYKDYEYITGAEKIVEVQNGIINSLISIPVRLSDLPRLATRTVTVFKLEPIADTGILSSTVTGFFKAKIAWIKTNVMQSEVLQSSQEELSSHVTPEDMKAEKESISQQIRDNKDDALKELIKPNKSSSFLSEETGNITDKNQLNYKLHIENLFAHIKSTEVNQIYGNPKIFKKDSAKEIFKRQLRKEFPHIKFDTTAGNGKKENLFHLPKGLINRLYKEIKEKTLNKKEDQLYKALMTLICRNSFPRKKEESSFLKTLFSSEEEIPEYRRCLENPDEFFEIFPFMHSKKITKTKPAYSNSFNMSIGSRFAASYGENNSQYLSKRMGSDLGFRLPLGEFFSSGIKIFDISYTWSQGASKNQQWSDDISSNKQLIVEKFMVEIEGHFEKCLLLKGRDYISSASLSAMGYAGGMGNIPITVGRTLNEYQEKLDKQYYFCDYEHQDKLNEPWYYIQANLPGGSLLRDTYGPTEVKLIKVLRGESTFREFKKLFEDETKVYLVEDSSNLDTPDQKLYQNWAHLLKEPAPPAVANKLLIHHFEGAFPGTIQ